MRCHSSQALLTQLGLQGGLEAVLTSIEPWRVVGAPTHVRPGFGHPQIGIKRNDGKYLENQQLKPTHEVRLARPLPVMREWRQLRLGPVIQPTRRIDAQIALSEPFVTARSMRDGGMPRRL